jgi:hypothetical protein
MYYLKGLSAWVSRDSDKLPIREELVTMYFDPCLHEAGLSGRKITDLFSVRNREFGLMSLIFGMNVRQIVLLRRKIHADNYAEEH